MRDRFRNWIPLKGEAIPSSPATVEERVEEFVRDNARCSRIKPTEEELELIAEKAKVWEMWESCSARVSG